MNTKQRINLLKNEKALLTLQQLSIEDEKVKRTKEIDKIQNECNHDFKDNSFLMSDKTCKICGFWEGGL